MVGFKFSTLGALLIASMALIGCVPQAKQTECGSNEAFSPTQRKCLPINPSETSFIKIKSAVPTAGITQTANSGALISFTFMVDNPYNKPYRVRWLRNFNGSQSTLRQPSQASSNIVDHPYSISLRPNPDLYAAVGSHVITAQLLEATNNNVIDSHDFALELTNDPKPTGQGFTPSLTTPMLFNPEDAQITFSFNVLRNNSSLNTPIVRWTLKKLGTTEAKELKTDALHNTNNSQPVYVHINTSNPLLKTNIPTAPFHDVVGNYRLEASIEDGTETFNTYFWDFIIQHPDLGVITEAKFPIPGSGTGTVRAFNGVPYSNTTPSNFSYNGNNRAQFCVTVSKPTGQYGTGVVVKYYLGDSTEPIYKGLTTSSDPTICLDDSENTGKGSIVFANANPELSWSTSIRARVFDSLSNIEYNTFTNGTYPLVWPVQVEPQNKAPKLSFENIPGYSVTCGGTSGTGTVSTGCKVTQDQSAVNNSFVVAFRVEDEHYPASELDDKIAYHGILTRGATVVESTNCKKEFSDTLTETDNLVDDIDDYVGPVYTCRFNVPAADDLGSINPINIPAEWKVSVTVTDNGSPYTTTQKASTLIWELDVTELNTAPTVSVQVAQNVTPYTPILTAKENDTIVFTVNFADLERDPYQIKLYRCESEAVCSETLSPIWESNWIPYTASDWALNRRAVFTIPDGFVPDTIDPTPVRFRVRVIDMASSGSSAVDETGAPGAGNHIVDNFLTLAIENVNPAPKFAVPNKLDINPAAMDPNNPLGIDFTVFGSFPITLDPGLITDASNPNNPDEGRVTYQWWIYPDNADPDAEWIAIAGATNRLLRWSPGTEIINGRYFIKLCITDNSPLRTGEDDPNGSSPLCNSPALVKVENNIAQGNVLNTSSGSIMWGAPAVWVDTTATGTVATHPNSKVIYSAYAVRHMAGGTPDDNFEIDDVTIHVAKFFYNADNNGRLEKLEEISFTALDPWDSIQKKTFDVKDLQLIGDDNSLYIGYLAYVNHPSLVHGYRPEIRRIVKDFGSAYNKGERTSSVHPGTLGFGYYGYFIRHNQVGCGCWDQGDPQVAPINVQGGYSVLTTSNLQAGSIIDFSLDETNWVSFTVAGATETERANDIATKINASSNNLMKGFVARVISTNQVEIWGPLYNDYLRVNQVVDKLGNIFISGGTLFIPFINASTTSPNTSSLSIASFATNPTAPLEDATVAQVNYAGTKAIDFDNTLDRDGNLIITFISATQPGKAKLLKFTGTNVNNPPAALDILSDKVVTQIKVSTNQQSGVNNNYFVMAKSSDSRLWISRIPTNLSDLTRVWDLEETEDTPTQTFINNLPDVYDFHIKTALGDSVSASLDEARILLYTDEGIFAFRALANQKVTCGDCKPINKHKKLLPSTGYISMDLSEIIPAQKLGSSGNLYPTESTRNLMVYAHIGEDPAATNLQQLLIGVINADRLVVDSITRDDSNGYYTPVIFKN